MGELSNIQLLVAGLCLLSIGYFTCYTLLYEELKEKYLDNKRELNELKEALYDNNQYNNTYYYKDVA